jgi:ATP-dependent helicase YprA (DUF1998 family)
LEYDPAACGIDLPLQIKRQLEQRGFCTTACIHAANHAILAMSPLYAQCDITDIDTEHTTVTPALTTPSRLMVCCAFVVFEREQLWCCLYVYTMVMLEFVLHVD